METTKIKLCYTSSVNLLPLLPSKLDNVAGVLLRGAVGGGLRGDPSPSIDESMLVGDAGDAGPLCVAVVGLKAHGPPGCSVGCLAGPGRGLITSFSSMGSSNGDPSPP